MQQPKRFQAPTLAEAYELVRNEMGEAAVILSTRKAYAPGLFGQPGRQFVEVVARVPAEVTGPTRPTFAQDEAAHELVRAVAEAAAAAPARRSAASRSTRIADQPAQPARPQRTLAAFQAVAAAADLPAPEREPIPTRSGGEPWARQLDQMRGMLEQLLAERSGTSSEPQADTRPTVRQSVTDRLVNFGMAPVTASALVAEGDAFAGDETALIDSLERVLADRLPPVLTLNPARTASIFLVGPSGAGKTTTAVRMALDIQRTHGLRVVIAGTDVNRAGAPQQLLAFGSAAGIEVRLCYSPTDLTELLADPAIDLVMVDTAGHNGQRRDRMAELAAMLEVARQRVVLLTVPATMKTSDLAEVTATYGALNLDGMVLTRCDETAHFGAIAGVALESSIGLALTTHSDQVSDAPVAADNALLASAAVHARWGVAPAPVTEPAPVVRASKRRLARAG